MLTIQYIPYTDIEHLNSDQRIRKLLKVVKENKIVLLQGRLKADEESALIQRTMEEIDKSFKGIELATIYPDEKPGQPIFKRAITKIFLGDREGVTIIGPANVVKEIKRDPNKIELLTTNSRPRRRRK